jgi:GntR family transcriptional regulator
MLASRELSATFGKEERLGVSNELQPAVDRLQAVPLYHQIFLQLREEITSGERAYGTRMPTEQELAAAYDVSRITARRALDELAHNQFVERKRRIGTHVVFQPPVKPIEGSIDQALEALVSFGRSTRVKILEFGEVPARPPVSDALLAPPDTLLLRVARVRSLADGPLGYLVSWVPTQLATHINRKSLAETPMLSLIARAGVEIAGAYQTISASIADGPLAAILNIEIGSPLLRVSRTLTDVHKRPVQHVLAHYRPDRYQIRLDLGAQHEGLATLHSVADL